MSDQKRNFNQDPRYQGSNNQGYYNQNNYTRYNNQRTYNNYQNNGSWHGANQDSQFGMGGNGQGNAGQNGQNNNVNYYNIPWDQYELRKKSKHSGICNFFMTLGRTITFARNLVFNLIFLLLIFVAFGGYYAVSSFKEGFLTPNYDHLAIENNQSAPQVLYFDLSGPISEIPFANTQLDNLQRELEFALYGKQSHELIAIENALKLVANDPQIKKVIIDVDDMSPINLTMVARLGKAINIAKGKDLDRQVITIGTNYSQASYALAAYSDHIVLDPLGQIDLKGITMSSLFFKDLLDKANVTPYIFRAGHFKSAVEPFMLNSMSYDVRQEYEAIAFKSWSIYRDALNIRKAIKNKRILPDAQTYVSWLKSFNGDRAALQLSEGFVDEVTPLSTYLAQIAKEVTADPANSDLPAIITYQDYLIKYQLQQNTESKIGALSNIEIPQQPSELIKNNNFVNPDLSELVTKVKNNMASSLVNIQADSKLSTVKSESRMQLYGNGSSKVAVIYGVGEITDLSETAYDFTYDNLAPLIRRAKFDDDIAAMVLYLNSPGGSVTASEKIRRLLALYKESGKPLIVSMNGTAASGAYWIATQADAIVATPSTITGSIGVFGLAFGAHKLLNRFGAYQDGVATNELATTPIAKAMPQSQQDIISLSVEKTYNDFINLVATSRKLKTQDYQRYAEGQIFLADDAKNIGLVDYIGDLDDAIKIASEAADLKPEQVKVKHFSPKGADLSGIESMFFSMAQAYLPQDLTYALVEYKKHTKVIEQNNPKSVIAISPVSEPQL